MAAKIHPVILSGATGTRLWPRSRTSYPKQFLKLVSDRSLLQQTTRRVSDARTFASPLMDVTKNTAFWSRSNLAKSASSRVRSFSNRSPVTPLPPSPAAASILSDEDKNALMLVLPSDHLIKH